MQKQNLILLHGALGSSNSFDSLVPFLSKDFNVLVPDLKWHGRRSTLDSSFSMENLVEDFETILEKENIPSAHVFGFSMGGYVALSLALKRGQFFKKIITLGTKLDWKPEQAEKESKMLNPEKIQEKVPQFAQHLKNSHGKNWMNLCKQTANMMLDLGHNPILTTENIAAIDLPIRLALGDQDHMVSFEETIAFYKSLSKGEFQVFPNCPHPIEKVNPKLLADSILRFLE
ncbi:alpha/beta fold hydrolase [Marivirga harenae]|uniref:alpha/beta fold hydrolase n=1 Tax=Marivirga harenae TaxID=2010992 RepID=UPI0026E10CCE|nr:alpha/beta fold hydrolase [Marivirga harenae]WKV12508.1 alpha/beta fold hydrolase [Marivirga harenae]